MHQYRIGDVVTLPEALNPAHFGGEFKQGGTYTVQAINTDNSIGAEDSTGVIWWFMPYEIAHKEAGTPQCKVIPIPTYRNFTYQLGLYEGGILYDEVVTSGKVPPAQAATMLQDILTTSRTPKIPKLLKL